MSDYKDVTILVAIPCYGGYMHSYTASSLFSLGSLLREKGIGHGIITPSGESFLPTTRNNIAFIFQDLGYSHLMCIDADIQFAPDSVLKLLDMDVDFAVAAYRMKKIQKVLMAINDCPETTDEEITEIDSAGVGFCLIRKCVFEKLNETRPKVHGVMNMMIHDYYSPYIDPDEKVLVPEDVAFQRRWRQTGGKIWLNRSIKLGHYGGISYLTE